MPLGAKDDYLKSNKNRQLGNKKIKLYVNLKFYIDIYNIIVWQNVLIVALLINTYVLACWHKKINK